MNWRSFLDLFGLSCFHFIWLYYFVLLFLLLLPPHLMKRRRGWVILAENYGGMNISIGVRSLENILYREAIFF